MEFKEFGLSEPVAEALQRQGFVAPTPIQEQAIPPLLQGRDLMGRAETGSGKTLAFGIPLIERVEAQRVSIQALVVCPTRELAQQVAEDLSESGKEKGTKVALVVGGVHVRTQRMQIPGKQIVVGTPGRIIDLLEDRFLPVEWVEYFVLDEFDRLLEMGFLDDVMRIVKRLPKERQTALFSATVPKQILREAQKILNNPVQIEIGSARKAVETIDQRAIRTKSPRKLAILERLLKKELKDDGTILVFCNTKKAVRQVDRELWAKNFSVAALSGDHEQSVRFKVMERFRNREIRVLIATDVAARGLDIDHIGHVINFDTPYEVEDYVHRIGRTARAGRDGIVTTLVGDEDRQSFDRIQRHIDQEIAMISEDGETLQGSQDRNRKADGGGRDRSRGRSNRGDRSNRNERNNQGGRSRRNSAPASARQEQSQVTASAPEEKTKPTAPPISDQGNNREERPPRRRRSRNTRTSERRAGDDQRNETRQESPEPKSEDARARNDKDKPKTQRSSERPRNDRQAASNNRRNRRRDEENPTSEPATNAAKNNIKEKTNAPASRNETARPNNSDGQGHGRRNTSRDGRSVGADDSKARRGRRNRNEYQRWEEEQLNRPIGLIEDNWNSIDDIDSLGKGVRNQGKGRPTTTAKTDDYQSDNAPAPFEGKREDAESKGHDADTRGRSTRGSRGQGRNQNDQSRRSSQDNTEGNGKPEPTKTRRPSSPQTTRDTEKPRAKKTTKLNSRRKQRDEDIDIVW